jgi:hypothetical protein
LDETHIGGCSARLETNGRKTVTESTTSKFTSDAHSFTLSSGERAGVRASVETIQ